MPENEKTGLALWAQARHSTPEEILILMESEKPGSSKKLPESITNGHDALPEDLSKDLEELLYRGRARQIAVPIKTIASVCNIDPIVARTCAGNGQAILSSDGKDTITSNYVPAILAAIRNAAHADNSANANPSTPEETPGQPAPEDDGGTPADQDETGTAGAADEPSDAADDQDEPTEQTDTQADTQADTTVEPDNKTAEPKQKSKPAGRRKTKYTVTKQVAQELFHPASTDTPARDIRAFLLTVPGTKPVDVAMMTDEEAASAFGASYLSIPMPDGTLILAKTAYTQLIEAVCSIESYYVPAPKPEEA